MNESIETPGDSPAPGPGLSPLQRLVRVFVRPAEAWTGLERQNQWWIAFLIYLGLATLMAALLYDRAIMPMILDQFDRQLADGKMSPEQLAGAERMMTSGMGRALVLLQQSVGLSFVVFLQAFAVTFSVGFLMGGTLRYRLGLEIVCWSIFVTLPGQVIAFALAWFRETMDGVHVGFGAFVPDAETPSKLLRGLITFLDFLGPFSIWGLIVTILGAAALSGLPRRKVAWTLSTVQVVIWLFLAALAALFAPGA